MSKIDQTLIRGVYENKVVTDNAKTITRSAGGGLPTTRAGRIVKGLGLNTRSNLGDKY